MVKNITDFFSVITGDRTILESILVSCHFIRLVMKSFLHDVNSSINLSIQDKINELDNLIIEDRDDNSILSEIDPDLNMLLNMNDTIKNSSRYFDTSHFRTIFHKYKHYFSILNANIRGMATNLDKLKLFRLYLPNYRNYRILVEIT